jgi:hypothetical protein
MGSSALDADEEFDEDWAQHRPSLLSLMGDLGTLRGPSTGACEESAIEALMAWYRQALKMSGAMELTAEPSADGMDVSV